MQCSSTQAKAFLAYLHFCIQFFSCLAKQVKTAQSLGGPFLNWETQSILLLLGHPNFHSKRLSEKEIQIPLLVGVLPAQFSSIDSSGKTSATKNEWKTQTARGRKKVSKYANRLLCDSRVRYLRDQDFLGNRSMCLSLLSQFPRLSDKIEFRCCILFARFVLLGDKREVTVFSDQPEKKCSLKMNDSLWSQVWRP